MQGRNGGQATLVGQLGGALTDLKKMSELGGVAEELSAKLSEASSLVEELQLMRDDLRRGFAGDPDLNDRVACLEGELACQRAVFLRFLYSHDFCVTNSPDMTSRFLAAEQRYRAEYGALCGLVRILSLAKETT
jgi:hypothetical protein